MCRLSGYDLCIFYNWVSAFHMRLTVSGWKYLNIWIVRPEESVLPSLKYIALRSQFRVHANISLLPVKMYLWAAYSRVIAMFSPGRYAFYGVNKLELLHWISSYLGPRHVIFISIKCIVHEILVVKLSYMLCNIF